MCSSMSAVVNGALILELLGISAKWQSFCMPGQCVPARLHVCDANHQIHKLTAFFCLLDPTLKRNKLCQQGPQWQWQQSPPPPLPLTAQPRTLTQQPEEGWNEQAEPQITRWPGFAGPWLHMYIQHLYATCFALTSGFSHNMVMNC